MKILLLVSFWMVPVILFSQIKNDDMDAPAMSGINDLGFMQVEEQPMFPGCEDVEDEKEKKRCSESNLLQFIYSNINYPEKARKENVEGTVYVKFIVEKDGSITNAAIVRDIGAGCGLEALRVVLFMPDWAPGKQNGLPVRVQFNLPVKFKLEDPQPPPNIPPRQYMDNGYLSSSNSWPRSQPVEPPRQALNNHFPFSDGIYLSYEDFILNEPSYYPDEFVYIKEDTSRVLHLSSIEKLGRKGKSIKISFDKIWGVCINQQSYILHKKGSDSASLYPIKVIGSICHFTAETSFAIKNLNTERTMLNSSSTRQYILNLQNGEIAIFTEESLGAFIGDDFQLHQEFTRDADRGQKLFLYLKKYNDRNPFY